MLKRAIALVVVVLVNGMFHQINGSSHFSFSGSLAYEFNDRSGATTNNEQSYLSDSISTGIGIDPGSWHSFKFSFSDPPISSYSSRNDYSDSSGPSSDIYSNSLKFYNGKNEPSGSFWNFNPSRSVSPHSIRQFQSFSTQLSPKSHTHPNCPKWLVEYTTNKH